MQAFWFHHQTLYRRALWGALATIALLGIIDSQTKVLSAAMATRPHVAIAGADWHNFSIGQAPAQAAAASTAKTATQVQSATLPPYGGPVDTAEATAIAKQMSDQRFGTQHWPALYNLWSRESGWRPSARNPSSGACGIPQALPCHKITDMSTVGQITWGLDYIAKRYGNPSNAWRFWQAHHWY